MRLPTILVLALILSSAPSSAAPGEVQQVRWNSATQLAWDATPGAVGYHVYEGNLAGLPDNATCLVGSHPSEVIPIDTTPAAGEASYYILSSFDDSGEGSVGAARTTADRCVPARRIFAVTPDGDPGDGVLDGDHPLRNPSPMTRVTRRETTGVFLASGEFFLTAIDLAIPGRHLDWNLERTYRSQVNYDGPLGHNWDSNLNARLTPLGIDVRHHDGTGRREVFERSGSSTFISPPGRYGVLFENPDGSFTLRGPHGLLHHFHAFDGSNVQGTLETIEDRFGDRITLAYDHQGLLSTITDGLGRRVDLAYDDAGRLTTVTDFAGRSWAYGYDAAGDLTSARTPLVTGTPNGNDFPGGKTTSYAYSSGSADPRLNHCMLSIVNPNEQSSGIPWAQIGYFTATAPAFDQGRVDRWTIGGTNASGIPAGGTMEFGYESLNPGATHDTTTPRRRTTVLDRNGNLREYVHNRHGNRIGQTLFTNREIRPGEPDYTTTFAYNDDGELTRVSRPEGNRSDYTYDSPGSDRYREGNLLEVRRVADNLTSGGRGDGHGSDIDDLVTTYEYEPIFNLVRRATDPRGNDPSYIPQNGGPQSADRYSTDLTYCHQEGDGSLNGLDDYVTDFQIDSTGFVDNLGDVNGDGETHRILGTPIRVVLPEVSLDASSNQAGIEGDTSQDSQIFHIYNPFGQRTATIDPEGNVHEIAHHPENDPDGDGTPTPAPPDGRLLDPTDGGYPASRRADTTSGSGRNNGTDPAPADIETDFTYDAVGNLTHVVDGRGVLTRLVRNSLDEVVEVRRAAATADSSGPDGDPPTGRGEPGLTAFSFKARYEYDANGNTTHIEVEDRDQDHGAAQYAEECLIWDLDAGIVASETENATGSTLRTDFRYDANRNLIQVIRPEGNIDVVEYDERDLILRTTDGATGPRGGSPVARTFEYDGNGNTILTIDGRGHLVDRELDGHDRLTRGVDQVGNTVEQFYDPASRLVRTLHRGPVAGPTPSDRSGTANVDLRDVAYLWDEQRRLFRTDLELFVPSGALPGRPPVIGEGPLVTGDGAINTIHEYDRDGRPTFTTRDSGATVRVDYDGLGRRILTTAPDGSSVAHTWDGQHNVIESAETELSSTAGPAAELFLTTHFYDALGRRERLVDNLGQTTHYRYSSLDAPLAVADANGPAGPTVGRRSATGSGLTVQTNEPGNVTRYAWDAAGRRLSVERTLTANGLGDGTFNPSPTSGDPNNPDGRITTTDGWDDNSLRTSTTDDNGNVTTFTYDNLDRLVGHVNDDGTQSSRLYDLESNPTQLTDPNGSVLGHTYDDANRRTQLSITRAAGIEGTTQQTYEYDGLGRLTRATDDNDPADFGDDSAVVRLYDSLGRVIEEKQSYGIGPLAEALVDLQWSADALLTGMVYPSGRVILYGYDAQNRLTSTTDPSRSESASYGYFGMDRLHTRSYANGVRMTLLDDSGNLDEGFDGIRRVTRMRHLDASDNLLAGFEHSYDRASNRSHELRLHDENVAAGGFRGELWSFDSANRLVDFVEGTLDAGLGLVGAAEDAQSWAFDGVGNWAQMTRNGTTYNFTPNNLNEYDDPQSGGTRVDDGQPDDAYDNAGTPVEDGENRLHDKNGSRTGDGTRTFVFDFRNRLVRAFEAVTGAPIADYDYDAFDRRSFRQANGIAGPVLRRYSHAPGAGAPFVADSFSFAVEREMKESGEKGGTEDINIGLGELQECTLAESDLSGLTLREVVYDFEGPLWQVRSDGSSQYAHEDPRGNVVVLTVGAGSPGNNPGDVLERYTYDAYGKPLIQDASNQNKTDIFGNFLAKSDFDNTLLYMRRWYDPETGDRGRSLNDDRGGLYLFGGRHLNPDEGRFVTRSTSTGHRFHLAEHGRTQASMGGGGRYDFGGNAPVSADGPRPQTREHILLARQVGLPRKKISGYRTVGDITLKRGLIGSSGTGLPAPPLTVGGDGEDIGGPMAPLTVGGDGEDIGGPMAPLTVGGDGEDIGGPMAPLTVGGDGEDIGGATASAEGEFWFTDVIPGMAATDENGEFWFNDVMPGMATSDENGEFWFNDVMPGMATSDENGEFWFVGLSPGAGAASRTGHVWFESLKPGAMLHRARHRMFAIIDRSSPAHHAGKDMILKGKKILQN